MKSLKFEMLPCVLILATMLMASLLTACKGEGESSGTTVSHGSVVTRTSILPAGPQCANGGITVESGIDENGNDTLDACEVDATQYVCNGATSLINIVDEPAGDNCATGGVKIEAGVDANGNGVLEGTEVTPANTRYVCNGATGDSGTDGLTTLIRITDEPSGDNCSAGGKKIESGLDADRDGVLDDSEVTVTAPSYICNGTDGADTSTFYIGGTVSGLTGTGTLVLQNTSAEISTDITFTANGNFTFPSPVADGAGYAVTVRTQPANQTCIVSNNTGTIAGADVINVSVVCSTATTSWTWTWVSGSNTTYQSGNYGQKGVAHVSNVPGARQDSVSWIDGSGNLWLFGGVGYDAGTERGFLNDLWKFDGTNWTYVSGSGYGNETGNYGTQGQASASNVPGGRYGSISWIDGSGNLWLFGGWGYGSAGTTGFLNDLWKFDGTNWTWVSGAIVTDQTGTYGTQGQASASNVPGARSNSVSWIDGNGNLWLFGGEGYDSAGTIGWLNDLWKFNGTNWTWVSGSNTVKQAGVYGTQGQASASNVPGARYDSVSWIDGSGSLWLFGGYSYDSAGTIGWLNDLWKFDGTNWTWVSGSNTVYQYCVYGTQGQASASNVPGGRYGSISWIDGSGNFWLFGGYGNGTMGTPLGRFNDLWKFDGTNWTWMSGATVAGQTGTYGTKGQASASNVPGARSGSVSWIDGSGKLWLFGGYGYDSAGVWSQLNDLWRLSLQ